MNKESGIYCITNLINGMKYIGQTTDIKKRKRQHFNNTNSNIHLQNAMNKYGKSNFTFTILEYVPPNRDILTEREQYYIDQNDFKTLYNISPTASSCLGAYRRQIIQIDPKTKEVINIFDGPTEASLKTGISIDAIVMVCTKAMRYDKRVNKSYLAKRAGGYFWKYFDNNTEDIPIVEDKGACFQKKIAQIDTMTGKIIKIYDSLNNASKTAKIDRNNISKTCMGLRNSFMGFKWKFLTDVPKELLDEYHELPENGNIENIIGKRHQRKVIAINLTTKTLYIYEDAKTASMELNIKRSYITSVLNYIQKSTFGYEFYYAFT